MIWTHAQTTDIWNKKKPSQDNSMFKSYKILLWHSHNSEDCKNNNQVSIA